MSVRLYSLICRNVTDPQHRHNVVSNSYCLTIVNAVIIFPDQLPTMDHASHTVEDPLQFSPSLENEGHNARTRNLLLKERRLKVAERMATLTCAPYLRLGKSSGTMLLIRLCNCMTIGSFHSGCKLASELCLIGSATVIGWWLSISFSQEILTSTGRRYAPSVRSRRSSGRDSQRGSLAEGCVQVPYMGKALVGPTCLGKSFVPMVHLQGCCSFKKGNLFQAGSARPDLPYQQCPPPLGVPPAHPLSCNGYADCRLREACKTPRCLMEAQ